MAAVVSFVFNAPATTEIYTLSLHDALPISLVLSPERGHAHGSTGDTRSGRFRGMDRSEEHTSELQSQFHLVCRLLLEKKKKICHWRWNAPTYATSATPSTPCSAGRTLMSCK